MHTRIFPPYFDPIKPKHIMNYPAGTSNNPNAPWNQKSLDEQTDTFETTVYDSLTDDENTVIVTVSYTEGEEIFIKDYSINEHENLDMCREQIIDSIKYHFDKPVNF